MSDAGKPEEQDIPFQDAPKDARDTAPDSAGGGTASGTSRDEEATDRADASKDRTPPGPGSTGPTTVREDLGTLAEEARKLWATIEARVVAPAVESYPEVARHLGAAGREVAKAFRSAVHGSEQNWRDAGSAGPDGGRQQEQITVERVDRIDPPEQKNRD
ncbi:MAG: DUF5304 family protein [Catenulispora sp.]|nr:DUF5304 family protein [Catenulispora sp.]